MVLCVIGGCLCPRVATTVLGGSPCGRRSAYSQSPMSVMPTCVTYASGLGRRWLARGVVLTGSPYRSLATPVGGLVVSNHPCKQPSHPCKGLSRGQPSL
ncbi:hypothetical protein BHE74_00036902 [Ensete ventricosum]|uniref:Secreted protein n=1 Tax=Ensete ventricosum TaxID=4639 RepID=A0A426ZFK2_ENSVE|nr:hypothetical protein B296_00043221 [Ensete ventricosum]RWW56385.1 hypothetical protein BHE74_00036902 [Ensete ventricosum]